MKTKYLAVTALSLSLLTFVPSCTDEVETGLEIQDDTEFTENVFSQLSSDIDEAVETGITASERGINGNFSGFGPMGCVTRTVETPDEGEFPKIITLTFGENCEYNGAEKSGSIQITVTGPPNETGSEHIVTFIDFYVNGNRIEGTGTHTCEGNHAWKMVLKNGKITSGDGRVFTREEVRTRKRVQGGDTEELADDVFEITGSANGVMADGKNYTKEITKALLTNRECFWITSGTIETQVEDVNFSIDFGDGTCDNLAERKMNGETEQIEMNCRIRHMFQWRKARK